MADFDPPFGSLGEKRYPTSTEQEQGFPCGPADRTLFNGELYRIEAEIGNVITAAGIVMSDATMTQLRDAINALISAATGGNPAGYILMTQARARLPIFPDVLNTDGRIVVTQPSTGTVRLPGGVNFLHRGIEQISTAQTDFATDANKIYHLRWHITDGFVLRDLANVTYNPTAAAETSTLFDSTFDDMLIARVITNSSNIATITNLANKARLQTAFTLAAANGTNGRTTIHTIDFARTTVPMLQEQFPPGNSRDSDYHYDITGNTRYAVTIYSWSWSAETSVMSSPGYTYTCIGF